MTEKSHFAASRIRLDETNSHIKKNCGIDKLTKSRMVRAGKKMVLQFLCGLEPELHTRWWQLQGDHVG